jgi:hypothetical protein
MPNDARLGFAIGVALVIIVAIFALHRDANTATATPSASILRDEGAPPSPPPSSAERKKTPETGTGRERDVPATVTTRPADGEVEAQTTEGRNQ